MNRNAAHLTSIAVLLLASAIPVKADGTDQALFPLPSVLDFTRGEGWGVALGAGVEYETAYDGSDEYEFELEPAGAVQWRTGDHLFFWEGIELGWRSRVADLWLVQLAARNEGGRSRDDSDDGKLDGLQDQDDHIVGVVEVRRGFGTEWRNWIGGRVMAGESDFGRLGVLAAGHRFGSRRDGTGTEVFLFTTFGSSTFINKDFGVTPEESLTSGLPATSLDSGYRSAGLTLVDRRNLTNHFHLITQAGMEYYSSDVQNSPVSQQDYEVELSVSLLYRF